MFPLGVALLFLDHFTVGLVCGSASALLRPTRALGSPHPVARFLPFAIAAACFAIAWYGREPYLTAGYYSAMVIVPVWFLYLVVRDIRSFGRLPPIQPK